MRSSCARVLAALVLLKAATAFGQQQDSIARDTTLATELSAGESAAEVPRRRMVSWNEYEGHFFTLRVGAGFLVDYATYAQDETSKEQMDLAPGLKIRDSRLIIGGRIKTKRRITYQAGLMYDGYTDEWFIRQTGLMIAVPEAWGHFWIDAKTVSEIMGHRSVVTTLKHYAHPSEQDHRRAIRALPWSGEASAG
jgi:hypothetical protein